MKESGLSLLEVRDLNLPGGTEESKEKLFRMTKGN